MHLAPHEWMFLGFALGMLAHALLLWLVPKWRFIDVMAMDDPALVRHMIVCGSEWVYRHPEHRTEFERACAGLDEQL